MPWYAVSTKPHQEKQAESHIKQYGIEYFMPLLKENKIIRRTSNEDSSLLETQGRRNREGFEWLDSRLAR